MADPSFLRPAAQERMFLDLVQRLGSLRAGWRAVVLRLSRLAPPYDGAEYKRVAAESFGAGINGMEGHVFRFSCGDMAFVVRHVPEEKLEAVARRTLALFGEREASAVVEIFNLEKEHAVLLLLAQDILRREEMAAGLEKAPPRKNNPLGPDSLLTLDRTLGNVDVTNITRRQTVCTIIDGGSPRPLFEEIFVSIGELEKLLAPGVRLDADPWLFRYLTAALDQRVMRMLIHDGLTVRRPFSINLNIATVLSPAFARFENVIAPQIKGRLVIEMNKLDVFSDMNAFFFVRDYLHERGFRLCLDGVTHHTLPHCNRAKLGFDLIKLLWTPCGLDILPESQKSDIRALVRDAGQAHTILCRCEDERALHVGQELGIVMFQGRMVEALLTAS